MKEPSIMGSVLIWMEWRRASRERPLAAPFVITSAAKQSRARLTRLVEIAASLRSSQRPLLGRRKLEHYRTADGTAPDRARGDLGKTQFVEV